MSDQNQSKGKFNNFNIIKPISPYQDFTSDLPETQESLENPGHPYSN